MVTHAAWLPTPSTTAPAKLSCDPVDGQRSENVAGVVAEPSVSPSCACAFDALPLFSLVGSMLRSVVSNCPVSSGMQLRQSGYRRQRWLSVSSRPRLDIRTGRGA